jgi:hypothetical protein
MLSKKKLFKTFALIVFMMSFSVRCRADFATELLTKFLDDPGDFFFNLHTDNEDFSPLPSNRHGSIRFNLLPTFLPMTWINLSLKAKVLNDKGYIPQVDLAGSYGDILALRALESASADVKPTFNDYSAGIIISKQVNDKTKIFGGFKYFTVNMDVKFLTPISVSSFDVDELNF